MNAKEELLDRDLEQSDHPSSENQSDNFGQLSFGKIEKIMSGISEPLTYKKGMWVWTTVFFLLLSIIPKLGVIDPALNDDTDDRYDFNGIINKIILGLPEWAFWELILTACAAICGIYGTSRWTVTNDEDDIVSSVGDVDLTSSYVEMN